MPAQFSSKTAVMQRALELARLGFGHVEPNPAVGAVLVDDDLNVIADGWHPRFGGPHAEVVALEIAKEKARGATLFVTLEPCSHFGKTPPCADAVIAAGIKRVFIATQDPAQHVAGAGIKRLKAAGIDVHVGLCGEEAKALIAPFQKLQQTGRPWVHAKWAMTLDGKIATRTGSSQWISNEQSRRVVHQLRGRMDAIVVGLGTVLADDPSLTVRPMGPRTPNRIVLDRRAETPVESKLVQTSRDVPVIVVASSSADKSRCDKLTELGVEVLQYQESSQQNASPLTRLLDELGCRQMTNILIEGGASVLGDFWDQQFIDEVHCFIAPKLIGGANAPSPIAGMGAEQIPDIASLNSQIEVLGDNVYIHGRTGNSM